MKLEAVLAALPEVDTIELTTWVERRWVRPDADDSGRLEFREIDIARVRLIYVLRSEMEIADDAVPLVLSLIDQLHQTRHQLRTIVDALADQPEPVRIAVNRVLELQRD